MPLTTPPPLSHCPSTKLCYHLSDLNVKRTSDEIQDNSGQGKWQLLDFFLCFGTIPAEKLNCYQKLSLSSLSPGRVTLMMLREYWWCYFNDVMITPTSSVPAGPTWSLQSPKSDQRTHKSSSHQPTQPACSTSKYKDTKCKITKIVRDKSLDQCMETFHIQFTI